MNINKNLVLNSAFFVPHFLHPETKTWGTDETVHVSYLGANIYLHIDDRIYIGHINYHTGMIEEDDIVLRIESISCQSKNAEDIIRDIVPVQIIKLKAVIDK